MIFDIGTLGKDRFIQDFSLSRVQLIQLKLTQISYIGTLGKVRFIQDFSLSRVRLKTGFTV